ncbi:MAG: hypothetical protein QOJ54_1919 [Aliidongia sp.]|jgi:hypothetical protein|nr:hypothetical protein [Aliidongia sp.]
MASIPEARAGLVFRYRYLRIWQYERGEQVGKERPCCLLVPLKAGQVIRGTPVHAEIDVSATDRHIAEDGEVLILLIQSDRPSADQIGLELTIDDKRSIGLPAEGPSYVIVSEINIDRWPNGDMCLIPSRRNSFTYDRPLPGPTLSRVLEAFLRAHKARKVRVLVRHP